MTITAAADRWNNAIVTLEAGDRLGHWGGPAIVTVPMVDGNTDYDALIDGGIVVAPHVDRLADVVAQLLAEIDAEAEAERLVHMTAGAGQALVYNEKAAEALRFLTDPAPKADDYPILAASIAIEAPTLAEVARLVSARRAAWTRLAAAIESVRLGTKKTIEAAGTVEAARAARAAVRWPSTGTPTPPAGVE